MRGNNVREREERKPRTLAELSVTNWFTPENTRLSRAYGRYHYMAYGKVIQERPKDNRYDGTLKTPQELAAE